MDTKDIGQQKLVATTIMLILIMATFVTPGITTENKYKTQDFPTHITLQNMTEGWNVTWSGNSSDAGVANPIPTYCNASGIRNTTVAVKLIVNGTHGIEWINVSVGNLTNITNHWYHNASNITLWISGDNVSWEVLQYDVGYGNGRFPNGGGNLTINNSIWGVFLGNPWDYHGQDGVINENCSIYLRFQCNLTFGMHYGIYVNDTPWWVYIGQANEIHDQVTFNGRLRNGLEYLEECCIEVNKTVWNGTDWIKWYNTSNPGEEVMFNISFHNCGATPETNYAICDTYYDALAYYVPDSGRIKYPGEDWRDITPNSTSVEPASCVFPAHTHAVFHIPSENLTNFTYCNWIYVHFNLTVNNSNYSKNEVTVYDCPLYYEYWDSDCFNSSECYVNEWFNTSIECQDCIAENTTWAISEHIDRPCVGNGCYDEEWFEYETEFNRWEAYDDYYNWNLTYRYDNSDGNGTDELGLSYAIVNRSDTNRSFSSMRMRYNCTDWDETTEEPMIGIIYAYENDSHFDMILYGYYDTFLFSKRGDHIYNTFDMSLVESYDDTYDYYDPFWPTDTDWQPYALDPGQTFQFFNGIWVKTLYNEHTGHLMSKAWSINATYPFALDWEVSGWIVNETMDNIVYNDSECFGLVVWNYNNSTLFTADFDFIEEWRLNYSRDANATESQLENHSVFGNEGIPLLEFPVHKLFGTGSQIEEWDNWHYGCYEEYDDGNKSAYEYGDCTTCFYRNLSHFYNMESRYFDKTSISSVFNKEDQKDNIYYYSSVFTNISVEAPYNNSLYIQIDECTDGTEDSYDGAVVCIDMDNDQEWDDNDMAFYWYTSMDEVWYSVYNGTTSKYYGKTDDFDPEMYIWFNAEMSPEVYNWYWDSYTMFPALHRFSTHRVYSVEIPLYYLVKDSGEYLNSTDTFGLHIQTTDNDYQYSPVWENWNESSEEYYIGNGNDADSTWTYFMNCTSWDECVNFEEGFWNGVTHAQMQYWGEGRIGNNSGPLIELQSEINATKEANVSIINDITKDNIINYTINITNIGDTQVTGVVVNDTFIDCIYYIGSDLPAHNVTNGTGNIHIFNVTNVLQIGNYIEFNITVNVTADCTFNGTNITNNITVTTNESANCSATNNIMYGTNKPPIITRAYPYTNRTITDISLLLSYINASIIDPNGDNMDIYFCTNKTIDLDATGKQVPYWHAIGQHTGSPNGSYETNQTFNMDDDANKTRWRWGDTYYWWNVSVTDGKAWTNASYKFLTDLSRYDVQTPLGVVNAGDAQAAWTHRSTGIYDYDGLYDTQTPYTTINAGDAQLIWASRD